MNSFNLNQKFNPISTTSKLSEKYKFNLKIIRFFIYLKVCSKHGKTFLKNMLFVGFGFGKNKPLKITFFFQ
jgi:hypothetical protein